jgi:hypothetical protein
MAGSALAQALVDVLDEVWPPEPEQVDRSTLDALRRGVLLQPVDPAPAVELVTIRVQHRYPGVHKPWGVHCSACGHLSIPSRSQLAHGHVPRHIVPDGSLVSTRRLALEAAFVHGQYHHADDHESFRVDG